MAAQVDDFRVLVTRLRKERDMSLEDVAFEARQHAPAGAGVSLSLIQKRLAPGSKASPSAGLLEALAGALGVPPDTFAEWRLAKAREELDEGVVGLDQALENLNRVEEALRRSVRGRTATRAGRTAQDRPQNPQAPREGRHLRGVGGNSDA